MREWVEVQHEGERTCAWGEGVEISIIVLTFNVLLELDEVDGVELLHIFAGGGGHAA